VKTSESIKEISKAWVAAQGDLRLVKTNAKNPHFGSTYADLGAIIDTLRPILLRHGLSFIQATEGNETSVVLTTTLLHHSGEWIASTLTMKPEKPTPQAFGSCLSYARRYCLSSLMGMAETDDDGNAAEQPKNSTTVLPKQPEQKPAAKAAVPATQPRPTGSPRYDAANAAIGKLKAGESDRAAEFFGKTIGYHIDGELTQEQVKALVMAIDAKDTNNRESRWYEIAGNGSSPAYKDAQKFAELLEYLQKMGAVSENIASNTLNMLAQNLPTS